MSNVVLGTLYNGDFAQYHRFFSSFEQAGVDADLVMFTNNMTGEPPDGVTCIPFTLNPDVHNYCRRYVLYRYYLANNRYDKVMISDVRDVIFLSDPFVDLAKGLSVFCEDESVKIGDCQFNYHWIDHVWGHGVAKRFARNAISCAGVTLGDYEAMTDYLEKMYPVVSSMRENYDQGAHNGVVWLGMVPRMNVYRNGESAVLTMGYMKNPQSFENKDGSLPCIVHQYDRHAHLGGMLP